MGSITANAVATSSTGFVGVLSPPVDPVAVESFGETPSTSIGKCLAIKTKDEPCFKIYTRTERCFFIAGDRGTEFAPVPDEIPELDVSEWVRIVFCVYFSSADRLFVLGNDIEGVFQDYNYMYEFTFQAGVTGGIKAITGLHKKTLVFRGQEDNSYTDMWLIGWGSTFTSKNLAFRHTWINQYDTLTGDTTDPISDVSVNKCYAYLGEGQLNISAHNSYDEVDFRVWEDGAIAHCPQVVGSIDTPHLFWKAFDGDSVLQNTNHSYWGMGNTQVKSIYYDSRGKMLCVAQGMRLGTPYSDSFIMLDASHGTIVEPQRRLVPHQALYDDDVCSYCILSSTFVRFNIGATPIHFVDYTGRYLTIAYGYGTQDSTVMCIDTHKIKQGVETPLADCLMSTRNVTTDFCLANSWMLEVKGDGADGLITQEKMNP